jgi:RNA polymerase sigma-70 factor (ECF subfamily)
MSTDAALISEALAGNTRAFNKLLERHQEMVFALCMRTLRHREHALDAVQDTFVTVFRKLDRFSGDSAFSTWLYRVTLNTCYDQLRKRKRRHTEALPEHHDPADPTTEGLFAAADIRPDIEQALLEIPNDFRDAVLLADLQGIPLADVAEILGIPVGTVKSRIFRGRRLLADILRNLNDTSERQRDV